MMPARTSKRPRNMPNHLWRIAIMALCFAVPSMARAQAGGVYELDWSVASAGGGISVGGDYKVSGTAGALSGVQAAAGDYQMLGGFWVPVTPGTSGFENDGGPIPEAALSFALSVPVPNPMRAEGAVHLTLPRSAHARLDLFGPDGALIRTLLDGDLGAGVHAVPLLGVGVPAELPAGVYFLRLTSDREARARTRKLVVAR